MTQSIGNLHEFKEKGEILSQVYLQLIRFVAMADVTRRKLT